MGCSPVYFTVSDDFDVNVSDKDDSNASLFDVSAVNDNDYNDSVRFRKTGVNQSQSQLSNFDNVLENNNISFSSLNICGLVSKLDFLEHSEFVHNSNVLVFTETKTDITSESVISDFFHKFNFETKFKHRKQFSTFKSGGIAFCIKKELLKYCKIVSSKCPFVLWCIIDKSVFGLQKDVLLGGVYIPPEGTIYSSQFCFSDIENDIININNNDKYHVMLTGDFNAHVGEASDLIENNFENNDNINFSLNNIYSIDKNIDCSDMLLENGIPTKRNSQDKSRVNNFGNSLLDF